MNHSYVELFANALAITVHPKKPFIDWIQEISPGMLLDEDSFAGDVFLIPINVEDDKYWSETNFEGIFEDLLYEWCEDPKYWPEITYSNFLEWFEFFEHRRLRHFHKAFGLLN